MDFLFWQPVLSGAAYRRQFRRIEVAARALENYGNVRENEAVPVAENIPVTEIAGYCISSELVAGLSAAQLVLPASTRRVSCVELKHCSGAQQDNTQADSLSSPVATAVAAWREQGASVRCAVVPSAAFWQIAEAEDCPADRKSVV